MKKLFSFIKGLFFKIDKLQEQAKILINKLSKYAPGVASDANKALDAIDEIEEKLESQIDESEVVVEKVEKAIKTKNLTDATDAFNSANDFVEDTKNEIEQIKSKIKSIDK